MASAASGFVPLESSLDEFIEGQANKNTQNDEIPLEEESWFHGRIDRQDVPTLLKKEGDYLVRESPTKLGQFVLCTRSHGLVRHFVFQSDGDLVRIENQGFPSVRELLSYHVKNKVYVTKRSRVILLNPVSKAEKDNFEINRNDIVLHDKQLASGHFWDLTKGSLQLPVTVKSYKESVSETVKQEFLAEAEILKKFNHPNIVRLIGVCTDRDPFLMVLEFMAGGIFLHYLRKNGTKLDKKKLIKFSIDAAAGMEYLGNNNCIHRDVAARNCLIDAHDLLKISDFRMARQVDQVYKAPNLKDIPVKWTAPEVANFSEYTTLSDIWSFGVFLWETFSYGSLPYPELNNKETIEKVDDGYRMPPPADTPPEVYQIMKDCWTFEPEDRPRFYEILKRLKQIQRIL